LSIERQEGFIERQEMSIERPMINFKSAYSNIELLIKNIVTWGNYFKEWISCAVLTNFRHFIRFVPRHPECNEGSSGCSGIFFYIKEWIPACAGMTLFQTPRQTASATPLREGNNKKAAPRDGFVY